MHVVFGVNGAEALSSAAFSPVFESGGMILSLCGFIIFAQCVFAIFGMQMLGGSIPGGGTGDCWGGPQWGGIPGADCSEEEEYTRRNFETFPRAFLTSFQYMTGEAWSQVMFFYAKHSAWGAAGACSFFMVLFLWQNCITVSLFVAIILDNFSLTDEEKVERQQELYENDMKRKMGTSDPYVVVRLVQIGSHSKSQKKKTPIIKRELNPVWTTGNVFMFKMDTETATLQLTVFDWDLASADDFMGEARIQLAKDGDDQILLEYQRELPPDLDGNVQVQTIKKTLLRSNSELINLKLQDSADNVESLDVNGHLFITCGFDLVDGLTVLQVTFQWPSKSLQLHSHHVRVATQLRSIYRMAAVTVTSPRLALQVTVERGENLSEADDNGMDTLGVVALAFPEMFDNPSSPRGGGHIEALQVTRSARAHPTLRRCLHRRRVPGRVPQPLWLTRCLRPRC